jgi:hypothetical protein|tara:strand:- start:2132 stop:3304 length:1173 start_codon:yes stop_codon:yes gene_type:complete
MSNTHDELVEIEPAVHSDADDTEVEETLIAGHNDFVKAATNCHGRGLHKFMKLCFIVMLLAATYSAGFFTASTFADAERHLRFVEVNQLVNQYAFLPPVAKPLHAPHIPNSTDVFMAFCYQIYREGAVSWSPAHFTAYVSSARRVCPACDIVLFVDAGTAIAMETAMLPYGVNILVIDVGHKNEGRVLMDAVRAANYADLCDEYTRCIATDASDVYFQRNPFDQFPSGADSAALFLSQERELLSATEPDGTLGQNAEWVTTCWGADAIKLLRDDAKVICSGTIMGTSAGFRSWAAVHSLLAISKVMHSKACWADQGLLSYAFYTGLLHNATAQSWGHGFAGTINNPSHMLPQHPDSQGRSTIYNIDGSVPAAVHGWDRHMKKPPSWIVAA